MKTNGTRLLLIIVFVQLLILLFSFSTKAQPDYVFRNHILLSGTDLEIGAVYRFRDVKPGVDGILTIADLKGGMTIKDLDGPSGFDEALQPYINCEPHKQGYVEFLLEFVTAGSMKKLLQAEVPLTAIDIDGYEFPDDKLFETDAFEESAAFYVDYDMLGTSLEVKKTGRWYNAINQSAITYPGIDTVQKDVMFTAVHAGVSSVRFRVGADNKSGSFMTRLRSVYFKKFRYSNSFLAVSPLRSFTGVEKNGNVSLNWTLDKTNTLQSISIEKGIAPSSFIGIGNVNGSIALAGKSNFNYTDNDFSGKTSFYRLKMIDATGAIAYSSILVFRAKEQLPSKFKIFPSAIQSTATISVKTTNSSIAILDILDYAGRLVTRQQIPLQEGNNTISLNNINAMTSGNYLAVLKIDNTTFTQKIIKQ